MNIADETCSTLVGQLLAADGMTHRPGPVDVFRSVDPTRATSAQPQRVPLVLDHDENEVVGEVLYAEVSRDGSLWITASTAITELDHRTHLSGRFLGHTVGRPRHVFDWQLAARLAHRSVGGRRAAAGAARRRPRHPPPRWWRAAALDHIEDAWDDRARRQAPRRRAPRACIRRRGPSTARARLTPGAWPTTTAAPSCVQSSTTSWSRSKGAGCRHRRGVAGWPSTAPSAP